MKNGNSKDTPSSHLPALSTSRRPAAFLWDESFLWGVMAYKALQAAGLSFELIRAGDIRNGALADYKTVFVPGGWASNKAKALGDEGLNAIRTFVDQGGNYLGFCGGAGLATQEGIGLVPVTRRPTKERVPSFSGRIRLNVHGHDLWNRIDEPIYHAWWPSQFVVDESVKVLATYGEALPDAFTSDINVGDVTSIGGWKDLEEVYQINLDPKRLTGEPAVIEGRYGEGKVILSLVHFDTPDDSSGATALKNLWKYLGHDHRKVEPTMPERCEQGRMASHYFLISELETATGALIDLGLRNFLWYWRNSMLLQWRRGVRGLEYCTLYVMVSELAELLRMHNGKQEFDIDRSLEKIRELLSLFVEKAKRLLVRERFVMQYSHISYERCDDPEIRIIREELFSRSKSHGGLFKELIDEIDRLLYSALKRL